MPRAWANVAQSYQASMSWFGKGSLRPWSLLPCDLKAMLCLCWRPASPEFRVFFAKENVGRNNPSRFLVLFDVKHVLGSMWLKIPVWRGQPPHRIPCFSKESCRIPPVRFFNFPSQEGFGKRSISYGRNEMNYLYHVHNAVLHAVDSEHHQSSRRVFTYVRVVLNSFTRKRTSSLKKKTFAKRSPYPYLALAVHQASMEQELGQMSHRNFSVWLHNAAHSDLMFLHSILSLLTFISQFWHFHAQTAVLLQRSLSKPTV